MDWVAKDVKCFYMYVTAVEELVISLTVIQGIIKQRTQNITG